MQNIIIKKIDLCRDFAAGIYLSEAQNPIYPPPLSHGIRVYSILIHTRNGGGEESWTRENLEGQQCTKLARKYQHDWLYLQSINSDKHLPQSPQANFFR